MERVPAASLPQATTGKLIPIFCSNTTTPPLTGEAILPLEVVARQVGWGSVSLRRYFPELCQAILGRYKEKFNRDLIQQKLQEFLSPSESALSLHEVAQRLGYKRQTLRSICPDLCKEITARYLASLKKQHEERITALCISTRQAVFYLHQQGRYPNSLEVLKILGGRHMMRMAEVYATWRETLEELGYRAES